MPPAPTRERAISELANALRAIAAMLETGEGEPVENERDGLTAYTITGQIGPDGDHDCAIIITAAAVAPSERGYPRVLDAVERARREGVL